MTMMFRTVKEAVKTILINENVGEYQVIGFQRQEKSGEEFLEKNRMVEVYFKEEDFPKSKGRLNGPSNADVNLAIELTVTAEAEGDLSALNDPSSTLPTIQAALTAIKEASKRADDSFDELADLIYQTIMDARNYDLGLTKGLVSNRHVSNIRKDQPNERGAVVLITGVLEFRVSVCEEVLGETPVPFVNNDIETEISEDTETKTGIIVPNTP